MVLDPVCLFHGKRRSEHICLYCCLCCLCFRNLTFEECHVTEDGDTIDVCRPCATEEAVNIVLLREQDEDAR
jgi:hypothetical protein